MKASLYLCAAALGIIASPGIAGDNVPTATTTGTAAPLAKPEKLVCKRDTTVGTRLAKSICLTRAQWRARDRDNDLDKNEINDRLNREGAQPMPKGGG